MGKIIMTMGLPASGKSTWAKEQVLSSQGDVVRVNKDDLRMMVHIGQHSKGREKLIKLLRNDIVCRAIEMGKTVIVDDTNFHPSHYYTLKEIAESLDAEFEVNDSFLQVPLEECIIRDSKREASVGRDVIIGMYNEYLKPKGIEYKLDCPDAIICDLDGTLALYTARTKQDHYERDFENDTPNEHVLLLLQVATNIKGYQIIFTSGRNEKFREQTISFLKKVGLSEDDHYKLFMRKQSDNRPDYVAKQEMYNEHIKNNYNIKFVIDDRPQVVRLWRSLGLFVFDVNQSGVEF